MKQLEKSSSEMTDVAYQAFQINICNKNQNWYSCTKKQDGSKITYVQGTTQETMCEEAANCTFKSIGFDETNIPIIVNM